MAGMVHRDTRVRRSRSDRWALAYLCGRARAFRRGKLSLANVAGAIRLARSQQVTDGDVREALAPFGLEWDGLALRDVLAAPPADAYVDDRPVAVSDEPHLVPDAAGEKA